MIVEGNRLYQIEIKREKDPAKADKNFNVLKKLKMDVQSERHQFANLCNMSEIHGD